MNNSYLFFRLILLPTSHLKRPRVMGPQTSGQRGIRGANVHEGLTKPLAIQLYEYQLYAQTGATGEIKADGLSKALGSEDRTSVSCAKRNKQGWQVRWKEPPGRNLKASSWRRGGLPMRGNRAP